MPKGRPYETNSDCHGKRPPNRGPSRLGSFRALLAGCVGHHAPTNAETSSAAAPAEGAAAVRVTAAKPLRKTLRQSTVQPGQIQAYEWTPLFAKLPGYVQEVHFDIGDRVEQNRPLADLWIPELEDDTRQKTAQLAQAKAAVDQAVAAAGSAEAAVRTAEAGVREARAGTIRAEGRYRRWNWEFRRVSQLATSGSLDRKVADETEDELAAADAMREEVEAKVASTQAILAERKANVEKAKADLSVAHANVTGADAALARAKSLLQYAEIRMPYAGVVTQRNVNRGDFVQPVSTAGAQPLFSVIAQRRRSHLCGCAGTGSPAGSTGSQGECRHPGPSRQKDRRHSHPNQLGPRAQSNAAPPKSTSPTPTAC